MLETLRAPVDEAAHPDVSLPPPMLRRVFRYARKWVRTRGNSRYCPVCDSTAGTFEPFGNPRRANAACPRCGSLERHRMLWLFVQRFTDLLVSRGQSVRLLHVAPEPALEQHFRSLAHVDYLSADLEAPGVMVRMDVTDIQYPDNTFDAVLCSHVMEHVPDDRRAFAEFHRVLRPGGWAAIKVPLEGPHTLEDPTITDPAERLRRFGQDDHFRVCGEDYIDRISEAGFDVTRLTSLDLAGDAGCARMSLNPHQVLFHATKPMTA